MAWNGTTLQFGEGETRKQCLGMRQCGHTCKSCHLSIRLVVSRGRTV